MYKYQMNIILGKLEREQVAIDRYDKKIDAAHAEGDLEKETKLEQIQSNLVHHRNGMIDAMAALGFRIEQGIVEERKPGDPSIVWVVNEMDELKLR